jgi:putative ABC transport system substrate-binding protein
VRRRAFLYGAAAMLAAPRVVEAQQAGKVYRVGLLSDFAPREFASFTVFERALRELGYVDGQNLLIEFRTAAGNLDRLAGLAVELVRLAPDVIIVTGGPAAAGALKKATSALPVVFSAVEWDPVKQGLAATSVVLGATSQE